MASSRLLGVGMVQRAIMLDGRVNRAVTIPDSVLLHLAGVQRSSGCAWCGASDGSEHRAERLQPCPLGLAVQELAEAREREQQPPVPVPVRSSPRWVRGLPVVVTLILLLIVILWFLGPLAER